MANPRDIVEHYLSALYSREPQTARRYLADDLSFTGPAASFSSANQYLRATEHAVRAVRRVDRRKVFVDGQDVCVFYDLHIDPPVSVVPIAEWYHLEGETIASIRTILDTGPFTSLGSPTTEAATDPVCGMTVPKASAAETRSYAGQTYFFCNPGCAAAFDTQPEQYVAAA